MRTALASHGGASPYEDLATALRTLLGSPAHRGREVGSALPLSLALAQILSRGL
ncbi:Uncharacterised protein (plasmid) [Tsukamurella tyrosinosolvens]|uniref:Uncharacterized protein n=1 Tax=Tsukamurella tyrosinosolvens TaxID=57704 RepID=A0A1H4V1P0_TSUTY|nr:hypothetical protein [Tsukamurella tyrosinosolvens]SEC74855.1 hypothetical protein SAMN04489793_3110 [Tsukamurella tyrosinosolvens]VEH90744.1 Uncharacterised protein [Tsukamurella tyrosinosolvens]